MACGFINLGRTIGAMYFCIGLAGCIAPYQSPVIDRATLVKADFDNRSNEGLKSARKSAPAGAAPSIVKTGEVERTRGSEELKKITQDFTWPARQPSCVYVYPHSEISSFLNKPVTRLAEALEYAINLSSNKAHSYSLAPGGFNIASGPESVDNHGNNLAYTYNSTYSILSAIRHYRDQIFLPSAERRRFIVHSLINGRDAQTSGVPSYEDAESWSRSSKGIPYESLKDKRFTADHQLYALVYEYKIQKGKNPELIEGCDLPAEEHLRRSGINLSNANHQ